MLDRPSSLIYARVMQQLTPEGQRIVAELAQRHGFSQDAVSHMLFAVLNGNGSMAQFNHYEFGGSGQWMQGGMLMLGDMFNHALKGRVDSLCYEIATILANQPGLLRSGSFQSQSQSREARQDQVFGSPMGQSSLFKPDPNANWWPSELGLPNASGSQNDVQYAYFAGARRLAVKTGGDVWVYDTLNHQIGGFSQQQGSSGSIGFSSQFGNVDLSGLPVVSRNGQSVAAPASSYTPPASSSNSPDIFSALERLGDLKAKGILSEQEFIAKKSELLSRL